MFDVLAPDNVGWKATLRLGAGRTIQAPGATQAFGRSELVWVQFAGVSAVVRRPNIIGALLGKASAVAKITSQTAAGRAKHLRDFDSLTRLVGAADRETAVLSSGERKMLGLLAEDPGLPDLGLASIELLLARPQL